MSSVLLEGLEEALEEHGASRLLAADGEVEVGEKDARETSDDRGDYECDHGLGAAEGADRAVGQPEVREDTLLINLTSVGVDGFVKVKNKAIDDDAEAGTSEIGISEIGTQSLPIFCCRPLFS